MEYIYIHIYGYIWLVFEPLARAKWWANFVSHPEPAAHPRNTAKHSSKFKYFKYFTNQKRAHHLW